MSEVQTPIIEKFIEDSNIADICSPVEDPQGQLYLVDHSGDILKVIEGQTQVWFSIGGQPSCLVFDANGAAFLGDKAHQAILSPNEVEGRVEATPVVKDYEGRPLLGPNSMVLSEQNNYLYFTDSGPLGESSLSNPCGSVFAADLDLMILKPLAYRSMAHPSGIAISNDGKVIFVAETLQNRIIRFAQSPSGVHHASVFAEFTARLGPTCLAMSPNNFLYVARFDFEDYAKVGLITILNMNGEKESEIIIPSAPEISGMSFSRKQANILWVTEVTTASCYRITLPSEFI